MWFRIRKYAIFGIFIGCLGGIVKAETPEAYDIDMAQEICAELPLEKVEGVWLYPDDQVTVLILNVNREQSDNRLPEYSISIVDTSDARLHPGEVIGSLKATPDEKVYKIELATERHNHLLLKPVSCLASLTGDGERLIIKKQKVPLKGRLNLNFNRLLPGFWKIVSTGISSTGSGTSLEPPTGMVKIYPSYDGNGSMRRKIRYL